MYLRFDGAGPAERWLVAEEGGREEQGRVGGATAL